MSKEAFCGIRRSIAVSVSLSALFAITAAGQDISYHLPVDSSGVGKILAYHLCATLQNELEFINKKINDRVFLETHLGTAYYREAKESVILGIKFNVINPKLPYDRILGAKIYKVRQLAKATNGTLDSVNEKRLSESETRLAEYQTNKWRRFSISVTAPVATWRYDTNYYWNPYDSTYMKDVRSFFEPHVIRKIGVGIGYDIGDIGTVSIGSTIKSPREIYGCVTFDVSTPTYIITSTFLDNVISLFYPRVRSTPNIEGYPY